ncbi:MAG: DUF4835 family protein [Lewinellaceae bacterium]|nr:DUF4835 family protein [Saprospiraceae bacterium]MCB9308203.1 DUF4835 family protein [Lewinellaceae bacterium]
MLRKISLSVLFAVCLSALFAQGELNATVRVSTPQLQKNDRKVFDQLETSLRDFLNNTKWTQDAFEPEERVKCNFILTISEEQDNNIFRAELAVQATRPVFGSGYETALLSHLDKDVVFAYEQSQPIEFLADATDNQNLPALFAFYAYVILGLDYDSYSLYGGDQYLLTAQQIVTNIQNSSTNSTPGWRPADGGKNRNRYWIIENLLNPRVKPYRSAMYNYYRKGLDMFTTDMDKAKSVILQSLEEIEKVNTAYFNSMIIQMFANAKKDELVEMWKVAGRPQKERVIQIMTKIDPANSQRYREIGT